MLSQHQGPTFEPAIGRASAACQAEDPRAVERLLVRGSAAEFLHGTWRRMMGTNGHTYRSYSHENVMKKTMKQTIIHHHFSSSIQIWGEIRLRIFH
jgi:hypothetical protein